MKKITIETQIRILLAARDYFRLASKEAEEKTEKWFIKELLKIAIDSAKKSYP